MRVLDFRITLFDLTLFFRLLCQYPGVFYYLMAAASTPGSDLFSLTILSRHKGPIGWKDLLKIFRFQRWKLTSYP